MTLDEMVYEVWEEVRRNIVDDDEIDYRLIAKQIHDQRATWVENSLNKNEAFDRFSQSLGTITFEPAPASFDEQTDLGRVMLVSQQTIPTPMYLNKKPLFSIAPIAIHGIYFKYADPQTIWAVGNGKFNARQIFYTWINDKIMLVANDSNNFQFLKNLHIEAILEDPSELSTFNASTTDYPINGKTWTYMREFVVKALLRKISSTEDKINNSTNDYIQERKGDV